MTKSLAIEMSIVFTVLISLLAVVVYGPHTKPTCHTCYWRCDNATNHIGNLPVTGSFEFEPIGREIIPLQSMAEEKHSPAAKGPGCRVIIVSITPNPKY